MDGLKTNGLTLTAVFVAFTAALWVTYGPWAAVAGSFLVHSLIAFLQAVIERVDKERRVREAESYARPLSESERGVVRGEHHASDLH